MTTGRKRKVHWRSRSAALLLVIAGFVLLKFSLLTKG